MKGWKYLTEKNLLAKLAEKNLLAKMDGGGSLARKTNVGQFWFQVRERGKVIDTRATDDPFITTIVKPKGLKTCIAMLRGNYVIEVQVGGTQAAHKVIFGSDYTEEAVKDFREIAGSTDNKPFTQGMKNWWRAVKDYLAGEGKYKDKKVDMP